jgi:predicted dehydrogenase
MILRMDAFRPVRQQMSRLRLGIIGCGAVTQEYHLPALEHVKELECVLLVDSDIKRASESALRFKIPDVSDDPADAFGNVDLVLVATPNTLHAPMSVDFLEKGIHVLCEKPMATSLDEANRMIQASESGKALLGVGMVRRTFRSLKKVKSLLESGELGMPKVFLMQEGSAYNWPLRSHSLFDVKQSAGGAFLSKGIHMLDTAIWFFGPDFEVESYYDDSYGGTEANANARLGFRSTAGEVEGVVEVSYTRNLGNRLMIEFERGSVVVDISSEKVSVLPRLLLNSKGPVGEIRSFELSGSVLQYFAEQLSGFAQAVNGNGAQYVSGLEAINGIRLVVECYSRRQPLINDWQRYTSPLGERHD